MAAQTTSPESAQPDGQETTQLTTQPKTQLDFGILLLVNNEPVALRPTEEYANAINAVTLAKLDGKKYQLTRPCHVGSLNDFNQFLQKYGMSMPKAEDFPSPLDEVYNKLTSLELTVEEFMVNIPGSHKVKAGSINKARPQLLPTDIEAKTPEEKAATPTTYVLAVTVQWKSGEQVDLIQDTLAIQGFYCKISKL